VPDVSPVPSPSDSIDVSEFHPLDHWPGDMRCRTLPGGFRRHMSYAWDFKARHWWRIRRRTLCRLRWHNMVDAWRRDEGPVRVCRACRQEEPRTVGTRVD